MFQFKRTASANTLRQGSAEHTPRAKRRSVCSRETRVIGRVVGGEISEIRQGGNWEVLSRRMSGSIFWSMQPRRLANQLTSHTAFLCLFLRLFQPGQTSGLI